MAKRKAVAWIVLLAASAVTLLIPVIHQGFTADEYREWLKGDKPEWTGIIRLWHISTWNAGSGSFSGWLKNIYRPFEKSHYGVFIEVEGITPNEAESRIASGDIPDMVSFGTGFFNSENELLIPLPNQDNMLRALDGTARQGSARMAYPYAMGGYVLLINEDYLSDAELEAPEDWPDADWFAEVFDKISGEREDSSGNKKTVNAIAFADNEWKLPQAALCATLEGKLNVVGGTGKPEDFINGDVAMYVCSQSELALMEKLGEKTPLPSMISLPLAGYTDMVQYISVVENMPEKKRGICIEAAGFLLKESVQKQLGNIGVMPVITLDEPVLTNEYMAPLEERFDDGFAAPNSFEWGAMREKARAMLIDGTDSGIKWDKLYDLLLKCIVKGQKKE